MHGKYKGEQGDKEQLYDDVIVETDKFAREFGLVLPPAESSDSMMSDWKPYVVAEAGISTTDTIRLFDNDSATYKPLAALESLRPSDIPSPDAVYMAIKLLGEEGGMVMDPKRPWIRTELIPHAAQNVFRSDQQRWAMPLYSMRSGSRQWTLLVVEWQRSTIEYHCDATVYDSAVEDAENITDEDRDAIYTYKENKDEDFAPGRWLQRQATGGEGYCRVHRTPCRVVLLSRPN